MNLTQVHIREGSIDEVVTLSQMIPEFDNPYSSEEYLNRLNNKKHLIAVAELHNQLVGFKVGYEWTDNATFYSWMGGVLPEFRKMGVARNLAEFQEQYARRNGFERILMKTRNMHKNMLIFAIASGFNIIQVEPKSEVLENRILLSKKI